LLCQAVMEMVEKID